MYTKHVCPKTIDQNARKYIEQFIPPDEPHLDQSREAIPVCWPDLGGNELAYIQECLKSGWISSQGAYVNLFEKRFSDYCGVAHAVSVTNGTHALHLALAALDIGPGDEVIVPTFTMIATANAVRYCGAKPVFVDARMDTWNIDETKIEEAITSKTRAIIVVHIYGHPCEMDTIHAIATKYKLAVIEDAAEAHGSMYKGKKVGSLGDIGCFSLYSNKMISTGEGGIVTTNNPQLHHILHKLHNHAFDDVIHFWHEYLGYNYRMTNLQAAIGCAQLERIDLFVESRRKNALEYMRHLQMLPHIQFPVELPEVVNSYWMFGILLQKGFPLTRDQVRHKLASFGIETRTFFIPMHLQPIYYTPEYQGKFPVSEQLCKNGLYLPSSSALTKEKIEFISKKIIELVKS